MWYLIIAVAAILLTIIGVNLLVLKPVKDQLHNTYSNIILLRKKKSNATSASIKQLQSQIDGELKLLVQEHTEQIEKLRNTESYRKEFLSNVSHELRTPIFSAQGFIHTLIEGGIDDPDVNHVYLNKAAKALDRLISIVDDLESILKLESGELNLEMRTFDICDLIKDTVESLEIVSVAKKIMLYIGFDKSKQIYVKADKERIRQVLTNLIMNSIKYGRENGRTELSVLESENTITVEVTDNGIGIENEHLPRLFERFYRVDKHRSRSEGGTALGLAIVKHIIEAHGESIQEIGRAHV